MRILPLFIIGTLVLQACGGASHESGHSIAADAPAAASAELAKTAVHDPVQAPTDRKIIRTGELRFEVDDLDDARSTILQRVQAEGGYVEGDDRGDMGRRRTITMRVRIPAAHFDVFVAGLNGLGRLEYRSINATDVTTEWVDVEARLEAKRTVEKRYLELAAQAKNVTEMLEVERELGNVRAEIESMEARMKSLRDQVGMSTLTITCVKPQAAVERFAPQFGVAFREGWNNLLRFGVGLVHLWPFVILAAGLVIWLRRRRSRKST